MNRQTDKHENINLPQLCHSNVIVTLCKSVADPNFIFIGLPYPVSGCTTANAIASVNNIDLELCKRVCTEQIWIYVGLKCHF